MNAGAPLGPRSAPSGYELVRPVGTGASGTVWEAVQHSTGRSVALKLLDVDAADPDVRRRFDRERRAMATMATHPNVVTVLDAGVHDGRAWLAMELCARGSLAARIARGGPLDVRTALETLVAVAGALGAAHDRGILHCDVKPANILLSDYDVPAVGDFGIVRVAASPTTTASIALTLDHAAPELLDHGRHTPASDVYSLGTTTWELLGGHAPFGGVGVPTAAIVAGILTRPVPDLPGHVPPTVTALLRDMTAKDPADRPGSMAEVTARAEALLRAAEPAVTAPAPPLAPAAEPGRRPVEARRRPRAAAVVVSAVLVAAALAAALWRGGGSPTTPAAAPPSTAATTVRTPAAMSTEPATAPPVAAPPRSAGSSAAAAARVPLRVYDNHGVEGLAGRAAADFEAAGWTVTSAGGFPPASVGVSTVYFWWGTDDEAAAQELGREFGLRVEPLFPGIEGPAPELIVIVTEDYAAS